MTHEEKSAAYCSIAMMLCNKLSAWAEAAHAAEDLGWVKLFEKTVGIASQRINAIAAGSNEL